MFLISVIIGLLTAAVVMLFKAGWLNVLMFIVGIIGVCFAIGLFFIICEAADKAINRLEDKRPELVSAIKFSPFAALLIAVLSFVVWVVFKLYTIGAAYIWAYIVIWTMWSVKWILIAGLPSLGIYGIYRICKSLFGEEFASFWNENLCPKLIVQ